MDVLNENLWNQTITFVASDFSMGTSQSVWYENSTYGALPLSRYDVSTYLSVFIHGKMIWSV